MMRKSFLLIILSIITSLSFAQDRNLKLVKSPTRNPSNEKRKAVVIGMSDYDAGRSLNNTLNDADDITDVLMRLGFQVTLLKNNDLKSLRTNLTTWYDSIDESNMAVFYFSGHGIEVSGKNYLIPVGAELNVQADTQYNALDINEVLVNMDEKKVHYKLLILDASFINPWSRSDSEKNSGQMLLPDEAYVAFAANPGEITIDGEAYELRNGIFTHYLKQEIEKRRITIDQVFMNVSRNVSNLTNNRQSPYSNSSLTENFYFKNNRRKR